METTPAGPSRRQVYDDFYDELALHHDLEHADRMAHALLGMKSDGENTDFSEEDTLGFYHYSG